MKTGLCTIAITCVLCLGLASGAAADIPKIIFDTDMRGDCDDAGALAVLHALADNGECEIIGVMASTTGPHVVAAIGALNAWYGRPNLPVGLYAGEDLTGSCDYASTLADRDKFPSFVSNDTAPESTALYRKLLHNAPDNSVVIVVVGGQPCVYGLLISEADFEGDGSINLTGAQLIEAKVRELVLMGGNFSGEVQAEWNITLAVEAAQEVARNWPGRVVYSGFEIGRVIMTGERLSDPENNPVTMAYKLYRGTTGGRGVIGNRQSWDQTAVYYAVRGLDFEGAQMWGAEGPVSVDFDDAGHTRFEPNPDANRYYLIEKMPVEQVTVIIEDLMVQPPRRP